MTMTNEEKIMDKTGPAAGRGGRGANEMTLEQWLAVRKAAALQIDPETAEVMWTYAQTLDPYGVDPELPPEYQQVGREYFARPSGSDVWVWFGDLPDATQKALQEKQEARSAFPEPTVYRLATELRIEGEDEWWGSVRVRIEQVPKLIEKMRAALKEHEADAP
jgi:hypothetical protein